MRTSTAFENRMHSWCPAALHIAAGAFGVGTFEAANKLSRALTLGSRGSIVRSRLRQCGQAAGCGPSAWILALFTIDPKDDGMGEGGSTYRPTTRRAACRRTGSLESCELFHLCFNTPGGGWQAVRSPDQRCTELRADSTNLPLIADFHWASPRWVVRSGWRHDDAYSVMARPTAGSRGAWSYVQELV